MDIGVKAFIVYERKILLILRDNVSTIAYPNTWNLPGGKVEKDETYEEALRRELMEELGIAPQYVEILGKQVFSDGKTVIRYVVRLQEHELSSIHLGDEGQRYQFFSLDDALTLPFSPYIGDFIRNHIQALRLVIESNVKLEPHELGLQSIHHETTRS